jgi:hypothetical protein
MDQVEVLSLNTRGVHLFNEGAYPGLEIVNFVPQAGDRNVYAARGIMARKRFFSPAALCSMARVKKSVGKE